VSPGRELDALVAEKVMAWIDVTGEWGYLMGNGLQRRIPEYSTRIEDAWKVVEHLRAGPWRVDMLDCKPVWEVSCWWHDSDGDVPPQLPHCRKSESLPLAICLAALCIAERGAAIALARGET
jgi:hypothetical protein